MTVASKRLFKLKKSTYYKVLGLSIIFLAALVIRLYPAIKSPERMKKGFGPFGDAHLYHCIAYNLYNGNGFSGTDDGTTYGTSKERKTTEYEPAVNRGPVYPFFIYTIYKFFGDTEAMESFGTWHKNWHRVRIAQCILDAFICILVFFIVRLICPQSIWPAFISAFIYAFSFYNIYYTRTLLSESVTTFLLALAVLFFVLGIKSERTIWSFLGGSSFGLVVLSRVEYAPFILLLAIFFFFTRQRLLSIAIKKGIIFLIGAALVIGPWMVRNYTILKKPAVITIGSLGNNLFWGTFGTKENWVGWGKFPEEIFANEQEKEEVYSLYNEYLKYYSDGSIKFKEADDALMELALERIRERPLQALKVWITRIPRLWYQDYLPIYAYREASSWWFVFYFIFSLLAFFLSSGREKILMAPVGLSFIYLTLILLPLHIESRYSVALMPGFISLTGVGIWKMILSAKSFLIKHNLIDFASE